MRDVLIELFTLIQARKKVAPSNSYTAQLFTAGDLEISKKVGEEAIEVIVAATRESDARLASEAADLIYHLMVLLAARGVEWQAVVAELESREKINLK